MDATIYRLRNRDVLILSVLALLCFGVVMVTSASDTLSQSDAVVQVARKNTVFAAVAMVTFLAVGFIDYAWIARPVQRLTRSPVAWGMAIAAVACLAVLVPGVGMQINARLAMDQAGADPITAVGIGQVVHGGVPGMVAGGSAGGSVEIY